MDNLILKEQFEKKLKLAEELLEEKYNEKFIVLGIGNFGFYPEGTYFEGICCPEDDNEFKFNLTVYEGDNTIIDSYRQAKLVNAMKEAIKDPLSKVSAEYAVLIDTENLATDYEEGMSPKEYNFENNCTFYSVLAINTDAECDIEPQPLYAALEELITSSGMQRGGIYLYLADGDEFADIKEYCKNHTELGSSLLKMCEGSFRTTIVNGKMEKIMEDMIDVLY